MRPGSSCQDPFRSGRILRRTDWLPCCLVILSAYAGQAYWHIQIPARWSGLSSRWYGLTAGDD
jgi:hypothetical protein